MLSHPLHGRARVEEPSVRRLALVNETDRVPVARNTETVIGVDGNKLCILSNPVAEVTADDEGCVSDLRAKVAVLVADDLVTYLLVLLPFWYPPPCL